jgi:hypothetical protein
MNISEELIAEIVKAAWLDEVHSPVVITKLQW